MVGAGLVSGLPGRPFPFPEALPECPLSFAGASLASRGVTEGSNLPATSDLRASGGQPALLYRLPRLRWTNHLEATSFFHQPLLQAVALSRRVMGSFATRHLISFKSEELRGTTSFNGFWFMYSSHPPYRGPGEIAGSGRAYQRAETVIKARRPLNSLRPLLAQLQVGYSRFLPGKAGHGSSLYRQAAFSQ